MGSTSLRGGVVALDCGHGVVDDGADCGLVGLGLQDGPAGVGRHPEDVLGDVLVAVLGGFFTPLVEYDRVAFLESVGDVLEEDEAEDDVLVLGGVHAAAEGVGHAPELGAEVEGLAGGGASGGYGVDPGKRWVWGHGATGWVVGFDRLIRIGLCARDGWVNGVAGWGKRVGCCWVPAGDAGMTEWSGVLGWRGGRGGWVRQGQWLLLGPGRRRRDDGGDDGGRVESSTGLRRLDRADVWGGGAWGWVGGG